MKHNVWDLRIKIEIQIGWTSSKRKQRLLTTYPALSGFCKSSLLEGDSIQTEKNNHGSYK
jgi:hypothetical protein